MSNKEYIMNLIENINDLTNKSDDYDLKMALDSEIDNDEEYTSDEVNKILGLNL